CATTNRGDPIVLYDALADRWLLSQFAFNPGPSPSAPFLECLAVSTGPDPTGSFHRYAFLFPKFNDYPQLRVWPDGYYMTSNQFVGDTFAGAGVAAFDRCRKLSVL